MLAKTQAECREKLKQAIQAAGTLDLAKSEKMTVGAWMDLWMEHYGKPGMRPATYANYETLIRLHIKPYIGDVILSKLTSLDLQKLYNKLLTEGRVDRPEAKKQPKGLSPKTVRNIHTIIYSACEKAIIERLLAANPAVGCTLPRKEHKEMKTLPLEKLDTFFAEAKESGVFELYYIELSTGLRRGELLGLKWTDIDWNAGTLSIQRQIQRIKGVVQETALKTRNAYRTIALPEDTLTMLKQRKATAVSIYIFPSPSGGMMEPDAVQKKLKRLLKRAGLEELRMHDLRHTYATLALQNGVDVKTLSGILGHYSAGFTLDTYGHISTQMQRDAAQKVGGFLKAAVG